jgi:L-fuculose-phosphate aldolase
MLITPSGIAISELNKKSMVQMHLDGSAAPAQCTPSSEWQFHAAVYQARDDLNAVVHAHPPYATALACARMAIPAFHYTVALSSATSIPCAPYATFGSTQLATAVVDTLGDTGQACLMANHGILCAGTTLDAALALAIEVEYLAHVYTLTLQTGRAIILDDEEMHRVLERVQDYGQKSLRQPC